MSHPLKDKVIWITGASSGIGEGLTIFLAKLGAKLVISARREDELQRVAKQAKPSNDLYILPLDLLKTETFEDLTNKVLAKFGKIDVLINNGGISQRSLANETSIDVDKRIMDVNYIGTVALTKAVLPHFIKQGFGKFVVTTSTVGKIGTPYRSGYCASKHALHGFFDALRAEIHDQKLSVLLVCPGFIHTNISVNSLTETGKALGTMDKATAEGLSPENCAKKIVAGIISNKHEIVVGGLKEKGGILLKRFLPKLFSVVIRKAAVR